MNSDNRKLALKTLGDLDLLSSSVIFRDGDVLNIQWNHIDNVEQMVEGDKQKSECSCGDSNCQCNPEDCTCDDSCDCPDCVQDEILSGPGAGKPVDEEPPARYFIQASGQGYWCADVKMNPVMGVDVLWIQKINGKDVTVTGTLYESNLAIFDYETPTTPEMFANAKRATFDYMAQKMTEAKDAETKKDADQKKEESTEESCKKINESSEAVMKSYG